MALRLIEIILPGSKKAEVEKILESHPVLDTFYGGLSGKKIQVKVLLSAETTEPLLDLLEKKFSGIDGFRIFILSVEATIPRPEQPAEEEGESEEKAEVDKDRVSREELYADIKDTIKISKVYLVMVVLSSIVAAIGILNNNVAVIIGAMVIAPLLGPNVALSLATTLGDIPLAREAMKASIVGISTALILSAFLGFVIPVEPSTPEIASRTSIGLVDIALALAAGIAGALAFTTGISTTLIGVMVAVALLPPLVTFGLLAGSGHYSPASGALLLVLANLICINLSGVLTFLIQGIHPLKWWEVKKARKATIRAIILWVFLLMALVTVILLSQGG